MTNHNGSFVWRKSWFCFTNQIICLASDIKNNDAVNPTITTLFQGVLTNTAKATVVNGTNVTAFPYNQTNLLAADAWLLDGYGTGYFVRSGANLVLARTLQTSPDQAGSGAFTSTNYATAWIHHGNAPNGASFEYVCVPATTTAAMNQLSNSYASAVTCPYTVLQRDTTAHVVQWKPDGRIGYAIFQTNQMTLKATTSAPIQKVSLPLLAMTQPTNNSIWLTVVNPDLNLINNVSTPTNLTVAIAGNWAIASGPTNASVLSQTSSNTTFQVTTVDGLPVEMLLSPPPGTPQTLSAIAASSTQVNLVWASSTNAAGYLLQRNGIVLTNVTGTNFSDTGLSPGITYTYVVFATNSVGISPASPSATVTMPVTGATLLWDANTSAASAQDGSGVWSSTATNWLYAGNNITWFDHNTASFGVNTATNCLVTLTSDVTPSNLVFNATGGGSYTLAGSNNIWTTDGLNIIASKSAFISAQLTGNGGVTITNASSASLTLSGTNTYTGLTLVSAGIVNVSGDQTAAPGGWTLTSSVPSISVTVNFNSGSAIACTNAIVLRNTMGSGFANATMNVSGTVTNSGTLNVNRLGVLNLNNGANWQQTGSMSIAPGGNTAGTSAMTVSNGATFVYTGSGSIGISPAGINTGFARLIISGGTFITSQGFANNTAASLTNATIILTNGGTLALSANIPQLTSGTSTNTFISTGTGTSGGAIDTSIFSTTVSNVIIGSGSLMKLGSGALTLTASNTFTGQTTISNGVLFINGSIGTGAVQVASTATLGGNGNVVGSVTVNGTVAPGSGAVGALATGAETWNGGGAYQFSLNNATNSTGWDLLNITGALNIQSATNNPFIIRLVSLTSSNTPGLLAGFDSTATNVWILATASSGIQNFSPAKFFVDTSAFSNSYTGTFTFATNGGSLRLTYVGAPLSKPQLFSPMLISNSAFGFSFSGPGGQSYRVLATTNLSLPVSNWWPLSTGIFSTGAVIYTDPLTNAAQKFFRIGSP